MAITIGQRVGSYEVTALLGKGGMGEVMLYTGLGFRVPFSALLSTRRSSHH